MPLARRRATTLRPLAVSMRERKPCLLTRFLLLGWNVRFISGKNCLLNVYVYGVMSPFIERPQK